MDRVDLLFWLHLLVLSDSVSLRPTAHWEVPLLYRVSALSRSFAGLMVTRFFLGALEAAIAPGFSLITAFWGTVMLILLPDRPQNALWLRKAERLVAVHRVPDKSSRNGGYEAYQVMEAFKEPITWCLSLYSFSVNLANGGLTSFGSLVIQGFGYEGIQSLAHPDAHRHRPAGLHRRQLHHLLVLPQQAHHRHVLPKRRQRRRHGADFCPR